MKKWIVGLGLGVILLGIFWQISQSATTKTPDAHPASQSDFSAQADENQKHNENTSNSKDNLNTDLNKDSDHPQDNNPPNALPSQQDWRDQVLANLAKNRPDVVHVLQATFVDSTDKTALDSALLGAGILQNYLDHPQNHQVRSVLKRFDCTVMGLKEEDQVLIHYLVFDTPERKARLQQDLAKAPSPASTEIAIVQGEPVSPCVAVLQDKF